MLHIGSHISIARGFKNAAVSACKMGADTFQFFTRNPRGGNAREINENDIDEMKKIIIEKEFAPILAHAPYTLNLCSDRREIREFALNTMKDDFSRVKRIGCGLYNFHPGSHMGQGIKKGIEYVAEALDLLSYYMPGIRVLLETMSGKGTEIGSNFDELRDILGKMANAGEMGICFDTCHLFSAGYDIVNDLDGVLEEFDEKIGLEKLKAIHLNDSMKPFGSKTDRHELIGKGEIGLAALTRVIKHVSLKELPFFLETPTDENGHAKEIELLKNNYAG